MRRPETGHNAAQAEYNRLATLLRYWALKSPVQDCTQFKYNRSSGLDRNESYVTVGTNWRLCLPTFCFAGAAITNAITHSHILAAQRMTDEKIR
jgi:hypothetical protein